MLIVYQNTVLTAAQDVENGLVIFLRAQQRAQFQAASVADAEEAVKIALKNQWPAGLIDFTRVTQLEQNLVQVQDTLAQARGEIGLGLIQVYRALGGGWQIRLTGCEPSALPLPAEPGKAREILPSPTPQEAPAPPNQAETEVPSVREIRNPKLENRSKYKARNPKFETKHRRLVIRI